MNSLTFYEWVNAAGYTPNLSQESQNFFKQYKGTEVANKIQEIGTKDPLVTVAPNHLRTPLMNHYTLYHTNINLSPAMGDPLTYSELQLVNSMTRHNYVEALDKSKSSDEVISHLNLDVTSNPNFISCKAYMDKFVRVIESLANGIYDKETGMYYDGPFKDYPFKYQIVKYICDKFMTVVRDPNNRTEFMNTGYFGIAMGIGARFDLKKIEQMIKELDPKKAGVAPDDIMGAQQYLKNSRLYNELSATNRYLALSCTLNEFFNKSDLSRQQKYTDANGAYLKSLENCIAKRTSLTPEQYTKFMKNLSNLYFKATHTTDVNMYASKKDDKSLLSVCNQLNPTSASTSNSTYYWNNK